MLFEKVHILKKYRALSFRKKDITWDSARESNCSEELVPVWFLKIAIYVMDIIY